MLISNKMSNIVLLPYFRYHKTLLNRGRPLSTYLLGKNPLIVEYKSQQKYFYNSENTVSIHCQILLSKIALYEKVLQGIKKSIKDLFLS